MQETKSAFITVQQSHSWSHGAENQRVAEAEKKSRYVVGVFVPWRFTLCVSCTWERLSCRIDLTSHLCLEQLIENLAFIASDGRSSTLRICFELFLFATVVHMFTFFFVKCAGEIRYLSHGFLCYSTLSTCIPDSDKLQNWKELTFPFSGGNMHTLQFARRKLDAGHGLA